MEVAAEVDEISAVWPMLCIEIEDMFHVKIIAGVIVYYIVCLQYC